MLFLFVYSYAKFLPMCIHTFHVCIHVCGVNCMFSSLSTLHSEYSWFWFLYFLTHWPLTYSCLNLWQAIFTHGQLLCIIMEPCCHLVHTDVLNTWQSHTIRLFTILSYSYWSYLCFDTYMYLVTLVLSYAPLLYEHLWVGSSFPLFKLLLVAPLVLIWVALSLALLWPYNFDPLLVLCKLKLAVFAALV